MPPVGFQPTISAGERPQTYALDRAATGTGYLVPLRPKYSPQHSIINATKILLGKASRSVSISYTNVAKFKYLEWQ